MTLSRREKLMVGGVVYILLIAAFVWFFYLPQSREIASASDANQRLSQEISLLQKAAASGDSQSAQQQMEEMEASFPMKPDQVKVMQALNGSAKKFDLVLKTVNNTDKNKAVVDKTGQLSFEVTTKGDFSNLVGFVKSLWESGRVNNVDSIELTALKKETPPAAAVSTSGGSKDASSGLPVYLIPPPTAPEAKSVQLPVAPENTSQAAATVTAAKAPEQKQSEFLDPGQYEMKMQIVFYYYSPENPAAAPKTKQNSGAAVNK